jgi:hydrogenase small subunit
MKMKRRDFVKLAGVIGAAATVELYKPEITEVFARATNDYWHICWIHGAACTGCTVSFAQAVNPDVVQLLTEIFPGDDNAMVGNSPLGIRLPDYTETLHPASGSLLEYLKDTVWTNAPVGKRILIVEGAVQDSGWCKVAGKDFRDIVKDTASTADVVISFGNCGAFGGIPGEYSSTSYSSVPNNVTGAIGLQKFLDSQGINKTAIVVGSTCPGHPDHLILSLADLIQGIVPSLDQYGRVQAFFQYSMHENRCPFRPYYDKGQFALKPGDEGCRYKIGCKGPVTYTDCALRKWNDHVSYCVEPSAPCIGCAQPTFPDIPGAQGALYGELPNLPIFLGVPTKTWGEALVIASAVGVAAHLVVRTARKPKKEGV